MAYYFPILLIVTSNVLYHICAKSIPGWLEHQPGIPGSQHQSGRHSYRGWNPVLPGSPYGQPNDRNRSLPGRPVLYQSSGNIKTGGRPFDKSSGCLTNINIVYWRCTIWFLSSRHLRLFFFSRSSRNSLMLIPPPYPTILPLAPMTRWQGMTMEIRFRLLARPTAREALGFPIISATSL